MRYTDARKIGTDQTVGATQHHGMAGIVNENRACRVGLNLQCVGLPWHQSGWISTVGQFARPLRTSIDGQIDVDGCR